MGLPLIGMPRAPGIALEMSDGGGGVIPDTDKWWGVTSSNYYDGLTSFSIMFWYDSHLFGAQDQMGYFSAYYKDGSNNLHGIALYQYNASIFFSVGNNATSFQTIDSLGFAGYYYATGFSRGKATSPRICICASWDSAGSGKSTLAAYNVGRESVGTRVSSVTTTNRTTALGNIGSNTEVRFGQLYDGTSTVLAMRPWYTIRGGKFWKNDYLDLDDFDSIVGYTGDNNKQIRGIKDAAKFHGGATGIANPGKDWQIVDDGSGNNKLGLRDIGADTAQHMVTANGSQIGRFVKY
tara:strand:+ start:2236 stop:3114 length:879 start_codon:yes stop_codon:yes gene_type:complete